MDFFYAIQNILLQYKIVKWLPDQIGGATFLYHIYFRFVILLDVSSFLLDGGGPGRNNSLYETVLSFNRFFNGRWCGSPPLILCRNDIDFEDSTISDTSSSMLVVFSLFTTATSFTPASFSCTSEFYITFFVFCFCSFCILHLRVCVDCENGVRS